MQLACTPFWIGIRSLVIRASPLIAATVCGATVAFAGEPRAVRVLSYNIRHGEGTDGRIDVSRIAEVIKSAAPDVALLQEVDRNVARSGNVDQAAELARLTGMRAVFGANLAIGGGQYGNAILARHPLGEARNRRLPAGNHPEPRGVLAAAMELPGSPEHETCLVLTTHLDQLPDIDSIEAITAWVEGDDRCVIIGGDFNARPESAVLNRFRKRWTLATAGEYPTFPATAPTRQIDFIGYRSRSRVAVSDVHVVPEPLASDHRPIVVTIRVGGD